MRLPKYSIILTSIIILLNTALAMEGKLIFSKGDVKVIRDQKYIKVKKKMTLINGDIIETGKKSLAVIKSKYTTMKVIQKSKVMLNFPSKAAVDATIGKGGAVIQLIKNLKNKGRDNRERKVTVTTRTAAMGVRGTKFMAYVGEKQNTILSVKEGAVDFKGSNSKKGVLVERDLSTMTNQNNQTIEKRNMGIVNKVNWELDDTSKDLSQSSELFSHLDKVWKNYKAEMEFKWKDRSDSQKKKWNQYINKQQGFNKLGN